jgi:DNA-binding NtrC family response regulator
MVCEEQGIPAKSFDSEALSELKNINWTGNIRELRNIIERLIILCDAIITKEDVIRYANPGK